MNKKVTGRSASMPLGILAGTLVSVVITLVASAVVASMVLGGKLDPGSVGAVTMVTMSISAVLGALIADVMIKRRVLLVSVGVGASYFVTLLMIAILLFGGASLGGVFTGSVIIISSAALVGVVLLKGSWGNKMVARNRRYR